jgi:amino acid transporter
MNMKKNNFYFKISRLAVVALFAVVTMFTITNVYAGPSPVLTNTNANTNSVSKPVVPSSAATTTNGDNGGFVICGNTADNPCNISHLFATFILIINYLMAMAGFVAVAAIVFAGFNMIYSQGQDQLKAAKSRFAGAIIGLVIIAGAYVLINSLFTGKFSLGVCEGESILVSPLKYIQNYQTCK